MERNLFMMRGDEQLGPYTWDELKQFAMEGRVQGQDLVWIPPDEQWKRADEIPGLIDSPQTGAPSHHVYSAKPKKKRGCMGCLVWIILLIALIVGGIYALVYVGEHKPSTKLTFGKSVEVAKESVPTDGGTLAISESGHPLDGFKIEVPSGAYKGNTSFKISYTPIEAHKFGDAFHPESPLVSIENGGEYSEEPILVTFPAPTDPNLFTMVFYYDRAQGTLEGLPLVDVGDGTITVMTRHFSDLVVSSVSIDALKGTADIDTGYRPGYDDWQFTNYGSWAAPNGHCSGQSISSIWYYVEKKKLGERPLYGRYDNNNAGYGTIDFWRDDSWGYRLASAIQRDNDWDSLLYKFFRKTRGVNDQSAMLSFAYTMMLTGNPQYVGITSSQGGGHAIVCYRVEQNKLYVADPNYPGTERVIMFENGAFVPYNSGANATAIAAGNQRMYESIGYMATTAVIDWGKIGERFAKIQNGHAGDDYFNPVTIQYLTGVPLDPKWTDLPQDFQIDTAATAIPGPSYTGKLLLGALTTADITRFTCYRGTDLIAQAQSTPTAVATLLIGLEDGVNDIGCLIEQKRTINGTTSWEYVDFQRFNIQFNEMDLTGQWTGDFTLEEAGRLIKFIKTTITLIIEAMGLEVEKEVEGEGDNTSSDFIEIEGLGTPIFMSLNFVSIEGSKEDYNVWVYIEPADDEPFETNAVASYKKGILKFKINHFDGSSLEFEGTVKDNDRLTGTFTGNAWGIVPGFGSGIWQEVR